MHVEELEAQSNIVVTEGMVALLIALVVVQHLLCAASRQAGLDIETVVLQHIVLLPGTLLRT